MSNLDHLEKDPESIVGILAVRSGRCHSAGTTRNCLYTAYCTNLAIVYANFLDRSGTRALSLTSQYTQASTAHSSIKSPLITSVLPYGYSMSFTTLPTSTTSTASLPLTTPFVQPNECRSLYDLISTTVRKGGHSPSAAILVSDAANPRFASCQPPGWDLGNSSLKFHFSPAVCPSGWTYYHMGQITTSPANLSPFIITTAYCCARFSSLPP